MLVGAWGEFQQGSGIYPFNGGLGGVNILSQLTGTTVDWILALGFGLLVFSLFNLTGNFRVRPEWEKLGLDSVLLKIPSPKKGRKSNELLLLFP